MKGARIFSRIVVPALKRRRVFGAGAAIIAAAALTGVVVAAPALTDSLLVGPLFAVLKNDQGTMQTESTDPATLNAKSPFFDPSIGRSGQACVTCHQPSTGMAMTVPFIDAAFTATNGTDPLFRFNDTAINPHCAGPTSPFSTPCDFTLFRKFGVVRIGKTVPVPADFKVSASMAINAKFAAPDTFPLTTDPQHPENPPGGTLSVFRRPFVNTNVNFEAALLWDGRQSTSNLVKEVSDSQKAVLLGAGTDATVNNALANFLSGVFTDQKSSDVA